MQYSIFVADISLVFLDSMEQVKTEDQISLVCFIPFFFVVGATEID